jgi:SAM-dependent methyltransferase
MTSFAKYARYYNLIYADKDYTGESGYIASLLRQYFPEAVSILELGSGTGRHAALLTEIGYTVHGIEVSPDMLVQAQSLPNLEKKLSFIQGDVRHARLNRKYDVVISLFHVFSYQNTDTDLMQVIATARAHLADSGILVFDFWYGPAVLTTQPSVRIKRVSDQQIEVTRLAEPELHPNDNLVDVNYHVFVRDKVSQSVSEISETHRMRYLFLPEINMFLELNGFELLHAEEWLTKKPLGTDTWCACVVARVKESPSEDWVQCAEYTRNG